MNASPYGMPLRGYITAPNGGLYLFDPSVSYGYKGSGGKVHYEFKMPIYRDLPSDPDQLKQRLNLIDPTIKNGLRFQNR